MAKPKLHHHLPQSYQDGFCQQGRIWVFDRATGKFRKDSPKNVAAITDDYTIYRNDGTRDTRVEELFAAIDSAGVPIIKKLRSRETLSGDERESFAWYLAGFVARVPRFRRWVNEHETARRKLHDRAYLKSPAQIQELIDKSDLSPDERAEADAQLMYEMLKSEEYSVSLDHNSQVKNLVETAIELQPRLHDLNWILGHATGESEFVTSDNPLIESASGAFLTFPVANDTALLMLPAEGDKVRITHKDMPRDLIHLGNIELAKASERLVLASNDDLLRRVVREAAIEDVPPKPLFDIGPPSG
jgi:uncharacterized protein DUF4238